MCGAWAAYCTSCSRSGTLSSRSVLKVVTHPTGSPRSPLSPQEHQSLYVLGKNISACSYEPLSDSVNPQLRNLVSSMLQPSPQARPTVNQLVESVQQACGSMYM